MFLCLFLCDILYLWPSCSHISAICQNISCDVTFKEMHIHISVTMVQKMVQEPCFGYPGAEGIMITVFTHTHTHHINFLQLHFNLLQSTVTATPSLFYNMISKFITTAPLLTSAHQTQSWQYLHQLCAKLCNWLKDFRLLERLLSYGSDNITTYYICLFFWKAAYGTKN